MDQVVSYFFLYSVLNFCINADTLENPAENFTITNISLASSNVTDSKNVSMDTSLTPLVFIDNLRSREKVGDGELSDKDRDSISRFNFNNLEIFSNRKNPNQKVLQDGKEWKSKMTKLSGILDGGEEQKMWLITEIDKKDLRRYLQLLRSSSLSLNRKKLAIVSTRPECSEDSQCAGAQVCHGQHRFCTELCEDSEDCGAGLVCQLGTCEPREVGTNCQKDLDCPAGFVCSEANICQSKTEFLPCKENNNTGLCQNCSADSDCQEGETCFNQTCSSTHRGGVAGTENCTEGSDCHHHLDSGAVETLVKTLITKINTTKDESQQIKKALSVDNEKKEMKESKNQSELKNDQEMIDPSIVGFQMEGKKGEQIIVDCGQNCKDFKKPGEKVFLDDYRLVFPVTVPPPNLGSSQSVPVVAPAVPLSAVNVATSPPVATVAAVEPTVAVTSPASLPVSVVSSAPTSVPPTQSDDSSVKKNKIALDDIESVANLIKILKRNPQALQGDDYKQSQLGNQNNKQFSKSQLRKIREMFRNNNDYEYYLEEEKKNPEIMKLMRNALKDIKENTRKVSINRKFCVFI